MESGYTESHSFDTQSFYGFSTEIHKNQPSFISRMADRIKTSEIWSSKTAKGALAKVVTFKFFRIQGINCGLTTIEDCLFKQNDWIFVSSTRLSYLMITTSLISLSPSSNTVSAPCSANDSGMMKAHLNLVMNKQQMKHVTRISFSYLAVSFGVWDLVYYILLR